MFGSNKRNSYRSSAFSRSRYNRPKRMPRWLVILLTGIIIGVGGFWFLQTNYGPKRLTIQESNRLSNELSTSNAERQRLQTKLDQTTQEVNSLNTSQSSATNSLSVAQTEIKKLQDQINLLKQVFPSDPSGTPVGIRAATLTGVLGKLDYTLLLMQKEGSTEAIKATIEFTVEGRYRNRKTGYAQIDPQPLDIEAFQQTSGSLTLPDTLTPRVVTIKIRDAATQKVLANRTFTVK